MKNVFEIHCMNLYQLSATKRLFIFFIFLESLFNENATTSYSQIKANKK